MKKIIITLLSLICMLYTAHAQHRIDFSTSYAAGGRLLMCVDSSAQQVHYANTFPNQPNMSFNYLPEVNDVSIQIHFRPQENVQDYRYTILVDDKPIAVNRSIDVAQLEELDRGDEEVLRYTSIGVFPIRGKTITTMIYSIEKPLAIEKAIFYGKPLPQAQIDVIATRFPTERGVDYDRILAPDEGKTLTFTEKEDELTIVKQTTTIDYLYYTTIKDKETNKVIFESTSWLYGGYQNREGKLSPYVKINKSIFNKSGDYEIIIQPLIPWDKCLDCAISPEEIESYTSRYPLVVRLQEEIYTKTELLIYTFIAISMVGIIFLVVFYFTKKVNKKRMAEQERQKNTAKVQLQSIRAQLNPHFLFNALAGIQNLINKNEIAVANTYLSKFARLTRNVLDDKELISLSQEKSLLDDYLKMEQLRFGFQYEMNHSPDLDLENIEIPSMLLQPFVENAVKHGISQNVSSGNIRITFTLKATDLVLTVTDNGPGFDIRKQHDGLGLQLSENRIKLLNSIYKENRFNLEIQSNQHGTNISLTLSDWL